MLLFGASLVTALVGVVLARWFRVAVVIVLSMALFAVTVAAAFIFGFALAEVALWLVVLITTLQISYLVGLAMFNQD